MRRSVRRYVWLLALLVLVLSPAPGAGAALGDEVLFQAPGAGGEGNFDLDLQVDNGASSVPATYGVHSKTGWDAQGFFQVHTRFGVSLDSDPMKIYEVTNPNPSPLNANSAVTDPENGQAMRWVHETPTLTWHSTTKKWLFLWATFPKVHPDGDDPYGRNVSKYGWIGLKTMSNTGNAWPDPVYSSLSSKETRLWRGNVQDCTSNALFNASSSWAQGTPTAPYSGYCVFSEPALYAVGSTLYVAMAGNYCTGPGICLADIVMLKSTNGGTSWSTLPNKPLLADDATDIDQNWNYFTAPAMYNHSDGSHRLLVSGFDRFEGDPEGDGIYQGMVEFKFGNISQGTLVRSGGVPVVQWFEPKESGVHTGAGTFHQFTRDRIMGKHWTCEPCAAFHEYELD